MPRLLRHTQPVARKSHQCDLCLQAIEIMERHDVSSYTDSDSGIYRFRTHLDCSRIGERMMRVWKLDSYTSEDFLEWLLDGHDDGFGDEEPLVKARIETARSGANSGF